MDSYRAVLEVLKLVSPLQVLQHLHQISQLFRRVTESDELWYSYILCISPDFHSPSPLPESIKSYYLREFMKKLPELTPNLLKIYYIPSHRPVIRRLSRSVYMDSYSVYAIVEDKVVLCGGAAAQTYVITCETGEVMDGRPMLVARGKPGAIAVNGKLYLFGGFRNTDFLRRAEKWSLNLSEDWQALPKMSFSHHSFSPSYFHGHVYLFTQSGCELFKLTIERFTPLEYRLNIGKHGVLTAVIDNELVVISEKAVLKVNICGQIKESSANNVKLKEIGSSGFLPTVTYLKEVYFLGNMGVVGLNIQTMKVIRRKN